MVKLCLPKALQTAQSIKFEIRKTTKIGLYSAVSGCIKVENITKLDKIGCMSSEHVLDALPKDTDIQVLAKYYQILGSLNIQQKLNMFFELNENMRSLMISGIKMLHPNFTHQQIINEIVRRVYGVDLERP